MALGPFKDVAADLAPGDVTSRERDWSDFTVEIVRSASHPSFETAYARLWKEFGASGGMERREVILDRLAWHPRTPIAGYAMHYEMVVVRHGDELAAVRDHTAILCAGAAGEACEVVVHLSHVVVEPALRGSGLAAWMRALPIAAARTCAAAAGSVDAAGVTLVAEMEHPSTRTASAITRLRSYGKAGFLMADPERARYAQPDFRSPAEIDRTAITPLPLVLILRRVGRESAKEMSGAELRALVAALYAMYGVHVRYDHMAPVLALLAGLPAREERVTLKPPLPAVGEGGETL